MTEEEWLSSNSCGSMLEAVKRQFRFPFRVASRKYRLVACTLLRRVSQWADLDAVADATERYCDMNGTMGEIESAILAVPDTRYIEGSSQTIRGLIKHLAHSEPFWSAYQTASNLVGIGVYRPPIRQSDRDDQLGSPTILLRDIFGNPFRPVDFSPSWRTSSALALAAAMYESRDFAAVPILADALEEAGCDEPDILAHCRGPGPHVRGCWVVDLVLGKA